MILSEPTAKMPPPRGIEAAAAVSPVPAVSLVEASSLYTTVLFWMITRSRVSDPSLQMPPPTALWLALRTQPFWMVRSSMLTREPSI